MTTDTPIKIQIVKSLSNLKPSRMIAVKADNESSFSLYVTDKVGVPYPLKDLQGSGGITTLINTDGNLVITGVNNKVINIAPALLSLINSALQIETDPIFQASEASNFVAGDKANLDNQSGINTGDETTSSIQTKRPLKTIDNESLEGIGNIQIDYNGLVNLPTIPSVITNHSELNLDDGTNPHGTTKNDVGLGNADNTSDLGKPISNATQTALNAKLSNDETTYTDATLPLSDTEKAIIHDGTNWVKITWNNIKAQLKTYFDTIYQAILVSGTNIKTINGNSVLGSGNLVVGSDEFLYHSVKWKGFNLNTINTWRAPVPANDNKENEAFGNFGSGTTPTDNHGGYPKSWDCIPTGYIIDAIELEVNYKLNGSTSSTLQVYIDRYEANQSYLSSILLNSTNLVNETVTIGSGSSGMRFIFDLTVASHSLPTLQKSFFNIAIRETTSSNIWYNLNFNFKFKKV